MEHRENAVSIRKGCQEDVKDIVYVMEEAVRSMERPEWFVSDDETFVKRVIALLNQEDVSICHMESVVLDCINLLVNDENYDIIKL